eukprot:6654572-Karenia_brevis.AAC.1
MEVGLIDLCGGIGGARQALELVGCRVAVFASSEIDESCRRVVKRQWPEVIELPPVQDIDQEALLLVWRLCTHVALIIVAAGSPCQDLSGLNSAGEGLQGSRSGLFFLVVRVMELIRQIFQEMPVFRFLEN